ncbi:MAG: glycosyltransferase [Allomuricauda sp.]
MIKEVIFVLPSLRAGGAERVMSFLASNLPENKYRISLIIIGHKKDQAYTLDDKKIEIVFLEKNRISKSFFLLFNEIRKRKPDIVISSIAHLNVMLSFMAFFLRRTAFIAREANVDRVRKKFSKRKKRFGGIDLKRIGYRFPKAIICQSQDMYDGFIEEYPYFKSKTYIINNPVTDDFLLKEKKEFNGPKRFITVGTLHPRKGHDRLLRSLASYPLPFEYTIVGDGEKKTELLQLAENLNIRDHITHVPFTNEVAKYLANSDFYLQGSYVEGFPNAVIESCAVGTPVLAFDAPGGINEIIENGVNGHVSGTEQEYLENLVAYTKSANMDPTIVRTTVLNKYGKKIILRKYEELFEKIA